MASKFQSVEVTNASLRLSKLDSVSRPRFWNDAAVSAVLEKL